MAYPDRVKQLANMIAKAIKAQESSPYVYVGSVDDEQTDVEVDGYVDCEKIAQLMIQELV